MQMRLLWILVYEYTNIQFGNLRTASAANPSSPVKGALQFATQVL